VTLVRIGDWIVGETAKAAAAVTRELEARRFNEAAGALYRFVWNVYCDWYLEFIKPLLNGEDEAAKTETRRTAAWVLDQIFCCIPSCPCDGGTLAADGNAQDLADRGGLAAVQRSGRRRCRCRDRMGDPLRLGSALGQSRDECSGGCQDRLFPGGCRLKTAAARPWETTKRQARNDRF
jgi:hypothetical protein